MMAGRPTDGIVRSGRRMLSILVRMVQTRLNLLAVEVLQEQRRIWLLLVLTALALIFVSMALLMLSTLVIVAYWEEHRLVAIACLLGFYLAATAVTVLVLRRRTMGDPGGGHGLFAGTLDELGRDQAALDRRFEDDLDFEVEPEHRHG